MELARPVPMTLWAKLAFAVVVTQGALVAWLEPDAGLGLARKVALTLACLLYITLACVDSARERLGTGKYLLIQHLLGLSLPWLGAARTFMSGLAVVSQTGLVLPSRQVIAAALLHTLNVILACSTSLPGERGQQLIYTFVVAVVFVMAFTEAIANELRTRERLDAASKELAAYAAQAEELATMSERTRIARELHDSLGNTLAITHVHLLLAERDVLTAPESARSALQTAQRTIRAGLDELRQTVRALHAPPLAVTAIEPALALLVADHHTDTLCASLQVEGSSRLLAPHVALALYRVAQEALTNVVSHARASHVQVLLAYAEREVRLCVRDDGVGMDQAAKEGFGLKGIGERTRMLGGSLVITRAPSVSLQVAVPT